MRTSDSRPTATPLVAGFHARGKLPHLKHEGAAYFVTFRLADSLPAEAIVKLKAQREAIVEHARAAKRPLTWAEEQRVFLWYCEKIEKLLDAGTGDCWLRRPDIAALVSKALNYFVKERYELRAWVVMPNHVHAVVWPMPGYCLSQIEHSWKSYTATQANRILGLAGAFWQKESYDHWIRDDDERARVCDYVVNNPVKAGLCARPQD